MEIGNQLNKKKIMASLKATKCETCIFLNTQTEIKTFINFNENDYNVWIFEPIKNWVEFARKLDKETFLKKLQEHKLI